MAKVIDATDSETAKTPVHESLTNGAADGGQDDPFAFGSLGRLVPTWWEPVEGALESEPWLVADVTL